MVTTIEEIRKDIEKIIEWIKIENFQKKALKKRTGLRELDIDLDPHYWENLKNQLTEPLAKDLVDVAKNLGDQVIEYDERIDQILELLGYREKNPDFEGVVKDANKPHEKTYWTNLAKKFGQSARDDNNWRDLEDLVNIIVNVKKHLGLSDNELDNLTTVTGLAMPTKKVGGANTNLTLKEAIDKANRYQALNIDDNDIIRENGEIDKGKLEKLKNNQAKYADYETIKNELNKIKNLLLIPPTTPLPSNWINQVAKKSELDEARNNLTKWTGKFPSKTPEQIEAELKKTTGTGVDPSTLQKLTGKVQSQQELIDKMIKRLKETGMMTPALKTQIEVVNNSQY